MTVRELYIKLNEKIPPSLSYEWDNDGIMCCPNSNRTVSKVLVALDVTEGVIQAAIEGEYDLIISHHPFIFRGLPSIDDKGDVSAKVIRLLKNDISVFSFHTRLDCLSGGVNDRLCALLELENVEAFYVDGLPLGRVGDLKSVTTPEDFAKKVKEILCAPFVLLADTGVDVHRVAVVGGSGKDALCAAKEAGADTFLSGRLGYHEMTDAQDAMKKINIIEAGHYYTENPICSSIADIIKGIDENIECTTVCSGSIKAI